VSATAGKRKEERETRAAAGKGGMGRWAAGPKEEGEVLFLNPFQIKPFEIKFKSNIFKLFHNIL
jgi:hypothetical protein